KATSCFVTFGAPDRFFIEKSKCSFEAKWLVLDRQVCHSSLDAQPPASRSAVPMTTDRQRFPYMPEPPRVGTARYRTVVRAAGQSTVRASLALTTSRGCETEVPWKL